MTWMAFFFVCHCQKSSIWLPTVSSLSHFCLHWNGWKVYTFSSSLRIFFVIRNLCTEYCDKIWIQKVTQKSKVEKMWHNFLFSTSCCIYLGNCIRCARHSCYVMPIESLKVFSCRSPHLRWPSVTPATGCRVRTGLKTRLFHNTGTGICLF